MSQERHVPISGEFLVFEGDFGNRMVNVTPAVGKWLDENAGVGKWGLRGNYTDGKMPFIWSIVLVDTEEETAAMFRLFWSA